MSHALQLTSVSKLFGGLRAVDEVSLAVAPGERRALIGPNGAGKTTLFNLIAGAFPVTHGSISLFGENVTGMAAHRRARRGLSRTFQISNLFPTLTVMENCLLAVQAVSSARLAMHRPLSGYPALHERAQATLESVGLADRATHAVRQLSHGEQRQLEIGLALAGAPKLLLLDEPTAGLSPAESRHMADLLATLDPAMTVLIIEHDMDIALEIARNVTVLHYGRVVADGTREEIRAHPMVREIYLGA